MDTKQLALWWVFLTVGGVAADAVAHGGRPNPPGVPQAPQIPMGPNPGVPGTPGAGPSTPGGGPGAGAVPGRGPATGGGRGPSTLGRKQRATTTPDDWQTWWRRNREPYLRARRAAVEPQTHGLAFLSGIGRVDAGPADGRAPTPAEVRERVVPALLRALEDDDPELQDSALIALGRAVAAEDAELARPAMVAALRSASLSVRRAALLGLGVLGDRSSVPVLWSVMNDTRQGRALLGESRAPEIERAFAALAIGFAAGRELLPQLLRVAGDEDVAADVRAGAVLAVGLVDGADAAVPELLEILRDRRADRRVRAQVPVTLGRIGGAAAGAVPTLVDLARDRGDVDVRRSAVIAIGELAAAEDEDAIRVLRALARSDNDTLVRRLAMVGVARVAARAIVERSAGPAALDGVRGFLLDELADPANAPDRGFVALAAGVFAAALPDASADRQALGAALDDVFRDGATPEDEGAVAIALGLAGAREAGERVERRFRERRDAEGRAHLAVALGLLGHASSADHLREVMIDHHDPALRAEVGLALGLLGDVEAQERLLDLLAAAPTFAATESAAAALGRVGDRAAIDRLVARIDDREAPRHVRAMSVVALGLIAEKSRLPWNAPLSMHANYATGLAPLDEVLGIY